MQFKNLYDVQFFKDYFENREQEEPVISENLVADFENYCEKQDANKIVKDDLYQAYQDFKENRDRIQEFEVVLAEHQIDKLVKEGIFIRINYGVKKDGLVFIPNRNLDIKGTEVGASYHVFIRETAQFFIYNKENSGVNRYMRGRDLIRQLTHDSRSIPKRRRPTLSSLKEKIAEINLLVELDIGNQSYQEVKEELIKEIAQLDLTITELQARMTHLNKVAEVLLNLNNVDQESRRLARYDYENMNLTGSIRLNQVEKELEVYQEKMDEVIAEYGDYVKQFETIASIIYNYQSTNKSNTYEVEIE